MVAKPFTMPCLGKIISTLGVFAAGSFRIIPSLNRIITARQHIKYYDVVIDLNETYDFESNDIAGDGFAPIQLSGSGADCDHAEHVRTQLPYALVSGIISILFCSIPIGMGIHWSILLPLASIVCVGCIYSLPIPRVKKRIRVVLQCA